MDISSFVASQRELGLQSGDFGLYKKFLGKRIVNLRRNLGCSTPPNKRQAPQKAVSLHDIQQNYEFAYLLVLSSERAWAQAMHIRAIRQDTSTLANPASSRRQIISKFHRAAAHASQLLNLVKDDHSGFEQDAILHARAYQVFLCGALAFEKRHWSDSLQYYSEARLIYNHFSIDGNINTDANPFVSADSYIDANLRYSAYQIGIPRSTPLEKVIDEYAVRDSGSFGKILLDRQARQKPTKPSGNGRDAVLAIPETIQWRQRTVKLEDAATAQALAQVQRAEDELRALFATKTITSPSEDAAAYDDVLNASQDVVDAVKNAVDELGAEGVAQGDPRMQALQITRTAVHHALISWRIGRNRVLCGNADGLEVLFPHHVKEQNPNPGASSHHESKVRLIRRIKEQVVLHDSILQSLESIEALPGVASDVTFIEEIQQKKAYFHTLRCLAIAQSHYMIENYSNSLALLSKARRLLIAVTRSEASMHSRPAEGPPQLDISTTQLDQVQHIIDTSIKQRQGIAEVKNCVSKQDRQGNSYDTSLVRGLDQFPQNPVKLMNIISWPPKIQPIPVKPIFLDVAYNYIKYPDTKGRDVGDGAQTKKTAAEDSIPKKGWFGFGR